MTTHADSRRHGSRLYWTTWFALLAITALMLFVDGAALPRMGLLVVLLVAMLAKASLIGANFMHLRFERWPIAAMVIVGLLFLGFFLFALIVPDALRIGAMAP